MPAVVACVASKVLSVPSKCTCGKKKINFRVFLNAWFPIPHVFEGASIRILHDGRSHWRMYSNLPQNALNVDPLLQEKYHAWKVGKFKFDEDVVRFKPEGSKTHNNASSPMYQIWVVRMHMKVTSTRVDGWWPMLDKEGIVFHFPHL